MCINFKINYFKGLARTIVEVGKSQDLQGELEPDTQERPWVSSILSLKAWALGEPGTVPTQRPAGPGENPCFCFSPKAGKISLLLGGGTVILFPFKLSPDGGPTHIGRATALLRLPIQTPISPRNTLTHTQSNVWPHAWAPPGSGKLTQKLPITTDNKPCVWKTKADINK